ncbi:hypothetical protein SAMN05216309_1152 [Nitrosomonas europaea]|nr:hypothetical protein SAMN05216310_1132 [Nitrosomonas europaea]SET03709.1 hypothetical protein SAMN05216309_1152 [Nitrosomonas europaea]SJZ54115.1 hypothetical protein SAMN02745113_01233 [Nitrosomonas europaea]
MKFTGKRLTQLKDRRKFWLDIHLWLGLVLGQIDIYGFSTSIIFALLKEV